MVSSTGPVLMCFRRTARISPARKCELGENFRSHRLRKSLVNRARSNFQRAAQNTLSHPSEYFSNGEFQHHAAYGFCGWLDLDEQHVEDASGQGSPATSESVRASRFSKRDFPRWGKSSGAANQVKTGPVKPDRKIRADKKRRPVYTGRLDGAKWCVFIPDPGRSWHPRP
jgi:hypothetical protein